MSSLSRRFPDHKKPLDNEEARVIVFIDAKISNCATLVQKVISEARVIVIGTEADGMKEITQILHLSNCLAVYIISHGCPGCLYLGKSELSLDTLSQYTTALKGWFKNNIVTEINQPRLSLYGCNLAAGDVGEEFITKLKQLTGVTIVASPNPANADVF
jgi:hypothetical protein